MNNYAYIIASLPVLCGDFRAGCGLDAEQVLEEIREQLSEKDLKTLDFFLSGFEADNLDAGFYRKALSHGNRFVRGYFTFDLCVRNAKAEFLNRAFGRPDGNDVVCTEEDGDPIEFDEAAELEKVLGLEDILAREKALDALMWDKAVELAIFDYFDMETVLSFVARLKIADRWMKLDEAAGREMFRRIVEEVRGTFKGVESIEKEK